MITLYITVRFKGLAFAVPVIAALLHDLLITVGVYSLTGREVTEATVAAVLTVLGYSIYDTIIIFDRIRENIPIMRRASFATIANVSLWETIRRSLATTFITLLPVAALFFFGGATLKDFAFALLVGVTSGAYSSIFIAAPLLAWWKEREPEYHRRKGSDSTEGSMGARVLAEAEKAASEEPTPDTPLDVIEEAITGRRLRRRRRSGAASGGSRVLMAEPGNGDSYDRLVAILGPRLDELRSLADDFTSRWRGDAVRVGEGSRRRIQDLARELGLVTREDWDELELRVAQLEHRLRLLENGD